MLKELFKQMGGAFPQYDWNKLKTLGTIQETVKEENGFKITTRSYISSDGKTKIEIKVLEDIILYSESSPLIDETQNKLNEFNAAIKKAVEAENYEEASRIKNQRTEFLKNKK